MRVDACGYVGLAPPSQFDPLLAKLICQSGSSGTFESAVERTQRALEEFQIVGVPTNGGQLRAILAHPGQNHSDGVTPDELRGGIEQDVH